ncbi:MAG: xanthine dehydrogenase family protein subunit M [Acidobacteriales bacterium]|nr:xanthine dehydrogenase family protein subunit M [Terriglobales bacterium]
MQAFAYASPATLQEAVALLAPSWGEADILAGGTDQISLMKEYIHTPKRVVNIKGLKELAGIEKTAAGVRIGALATFEEMLTSPLLKEYPAITTAVRGVASPQIRNMGTAGGDLCQRPRCWYFRKGFGLLAKDEAGKPLVPDGENRYHAIFGGGPAWFVSASSLGPALVALGAKVKAVSAKGTREIPVEKFFVAPADDATREIALAPNEILTEILVPPARGRNATYEVREREMLDWPLAAVSVALRMKGTAVASARVVLGHVAPVPWVAKEAEAMLAGKTITVEVAAEAGERAVAGAKPLSQNAYKVQLARTAVKRALLAAAGIKA